MKRADLPTPYCGLLALGCVCRSHQPDAQARGLASARRPRLRVGLVWMQTPSWLGEGTSLDMHFRSRLRSP